MSAGLPATLRRRLSRESITCCPARRTGPPVESAASRKCRRRPRRTCMLCLRPMRPRASDAALDCPGSPPSARLHHNRHNDRSRTWPGLAKSEAIEAPAIGYAASSSRSSSSGSPSTLRNSAASASPPGSPAPARPSSPASSSFSMSGRSRRLSNPKRARNPGVVT